MLICLHTHMSRKVIWLTLGAMMITAVALAYMLWGGKSDERMTVRFLDVGQGDAILISEGSLQVLIDGGKEPKRLLELLGAYMPFWDKTVDVVVATHPDEDHIGGLTNLSARYHIGHFLQTNTLNETQVFSRYQEVVRKTSAVETFAPLSVVFPGGARLDTIYPEERIDSERKIDSNDASIVMKLTYGKHSFLFTGDLPDTKEGELLVGEVDVLKVGHHGSKHSTSETFLERIVPEYAVLSVGARNRYGHPDPGVIEKLRKRDVVIFRTDERGTITFVCEQKEEECGVKTEK